MQSVYYHVRCELQGLDSKTDSCCELTVTRYVECSDAAIQNYSLLGYDTILMCELSKKF
jgi:hypothetical protein